MSPEVTAADRFISVVALLTQPSFWAEMAFIGLVLWGMARAGRTARSIPTIAGRFGLVVHWAALLVAVVLLTAAGLILATAAPLRDINFIVAGCLAVSAVVVWLVGKSVRFVLTGPSALPSAAVRLKRPRITSVPLVPPPTRPVVQPWGSPRP